MGTGGRPPAAFVTLDSQVCELSPLEVPVSLHLISQPASHLIFATAEEGKMERGLDITEFGEMHNYLHVIKLSVRTKRAGFIELRQPTDF